MLDPLPFLFCTISLHNNIVFFLCLLLRSSFLRYYLSLLLKSGSEYKLDWNSVSLSHARLSMFSFFIFLLLDDFCLLCLLKKNILFFQIEFGRREVFYSIFFQTEMAWIQSGTRPLHYWKIMTESTIETNRDVFLFVIEVRAD